MLPLLPPGNFFPFVSSWIQYPFPFVVYSSCLGGAHPPVVFQESVCAWPGVQQEAGTLEGLHGMGMCVAEHRIGRKWENKTGLVSPFHQQNPGFTFWRL